MPIKPIPNQGLRVAEPEYLPLKAYQSGGFYWDGEAQQVIRSILGDFLPPLVQSFEAGRRTGVFQLFEGGQEILSQSRQVSARNPIPAVELKRLSRSLEAFKAKANASETTPNNRFIIQEFKLPDFERDPELYRISGGYWNRRLHVLWGCERAADTSLAPAEALAKLPSTGLFKIPHKYWRWLAALLGLLLLLLLLWWLWPARLHTASIAVQPGSSAPGGSPNGGDGGGSTDGSGSSSDSGPGPGSPAGPAGGPGSGGNSPSAASPNGGVPPGGGPAGPDSSDKSANDGKNKNKNPPATGLEIQKFMDQILPDGRMQIGLAAKDRSNPNKIPKVDYWEVDGTKQITGDKITSEFTNGKHTVKVHWKAPDGKPAEISASLTVTIESRLEPGD